MWFWHAVRFGILVGSMTLVSGLVAADEWVPNQPKLRWWKGNIHTHSLWSDGNDFPEMIAEWYRTHDYNFLALSDHNVLSEPIRWMKVQEIVKRGGADVLPKYVDRFGPHWVELQGEPDSETQEVRLKPLHEFRHLVEERGRFIMIQAEEISDSVQGKPVHMNATNVAELVQPLGGETVQAAMRANLRSVQDQARRLGRTIMVHLNHPNFHYAITAEDLAFVVEEPFFEVYNGHPGINHLGDADHPGDESIWDIANAIRLGYLSAAPLMGVATDDSHSYHDGKGSTPGRGWVQVRARHLTPESLIRAMNAGDFYASSGVRLRDVRYDADSKTLRVEIDAREGESYTTQFVGSRKSAISKSTTAAADRVDATNGVDNSADAVGDSVSEGTADDPTVSTNVQLDMQHVGCVLATITGNVAEFKLEEDLLYFRAVITSSADHPNASFAGQKQQAWTQPVGWN
ncbi:MAG: hypothetical protein R3C28_20125 [Pirellulaceae bacterium]